MKYFVANWKQNLSLAEVKNWLEVFQEHYQPKPDQQVILASSFPFLSTIKATGFLTSAQDVSPFTQGAHTGRVGARQLVDLADFCLVGHSEVRKELGDTDQTVALKVSQLVNAHITPVVCVDLPYLDSQIKLLKQELLELPKLIVAYEPVLAIGSGKPENPRVANEVAFKVKSLLGKATPVLYGGSVTPEVVSLVNQEFVDGVLVGGSSLDPKQFIDLIQHA